MDPGIKVNDLNQEFLSALTGLFALIALCFYYEVVSEKNSCLYVMCQKYFFGFRTLFTAIKEIGPEIT